MPRGRSVFTGTPPFLPRSGGGFVRRPSGARDVLRLDRLGFELARGADHLLEGRVKRGRLALVKTQRVDPRDDERAQVGAIEAPFLQGLHCGADRLLELHDAGVTVLADRERAGERLREKLVDALEDRMVGAPRESSVLLVADA